MFSLVKRAAQRSGGLSRALDLTRVVTSSAAPTQAAAAAAAAAPAAKPVNMQEFQIYRWDPDSGGKPRYQSYQVRRAPEDRTTESLCAAPLDQGPFLRPRAA